MWKTIRQALPKKPNPCRQYNKETNALADQFNWFFTVVGAKTATAASELARVHRLNTAPVDHRYFTTLFYPRWQLVRFPTPVLR